jgi:two-component system NarL family response regulator
VAGEPAIATADIVSDASDSRGLLVLIADDHDMVRDGIVHLLKGAADIRIAGEARDGDEAVQLAQRLHPDVVVMDINMPRMDGIEATRIIRGRCPGVRVVGMTMHTDSEILGSMLAAGASAVISKDARIDDLLLAIRGVAAASGPAGSPPSSLA